MTLDVWQTRLRNQDRTSVILVRIEPFFEISKHIDFSPSWGTDGTYSDIKTMPVYHSFNNIPLPIRFVRVNGGEYQRTHDLTSLHGTGNVRKWWYDRPSGVLNIRPSGAIASAGMDTTIVKCSTALYFSTVPKFIDEKYWLPRIVNDPGLASVNIAANDFRFSSFSISGGNLSLINTDGFFDNLHPDVLNFYQARVTIWAGLDLPGDEMLWTDYKKIRTCWIDEWIYDNDQKINLTLKQISQQTRDSATKVHHDSDTADQDIPDDQKNHSTLDPGSQGQVQSIITGAAPTGGTPEEAWSVATPTVFTDTGDPQTGYGVECTAARTFTNPESEDVHPLATISAVLVKKPQHIDRYTSGDDVYDLVTGNVGIKFKSPPDTGQAVEIDTAVDQVRLVIDGVADQGGRFTGSGTTRIDEIPHLIDFFWSNSGLLKREIYLPSVTISGDVKLCTALLVDCSTGDFDITIADFEAVSVGYLISIGSDDNSGDGYLVTRVDDDQVSVYPALATDQPAGSDIKCFGEYVKPDWSDTCRVEVSTPSNYEQIISEVAATGRVAPVPGNDGKLRLIQMSAVPKSTDPIINDGMMTDWSENYARQNISDRIVIEYGVVSATGAKRKRRSQRRITTADGTADVFNRISFSHYGREKEDVVQTWGTSANKMKSLANSLYVTRGRGVRLVSLTENFGVALEVLPGQSVILYRKRSNSGELVGKVFWVIAKKANYMTFTTQLELMEAKE